jgi:hypothetical protein
MDPDVATEVLSPPGREYLEFCRQYLLRTEGDLVDPFALDLPDDKLIPAFVSRRQISEKLPQLPNPQAEPPGQQRWPQPAVTLVMGQRGTGKTTLIRLAGVCRQPGKVLVVTLPIASAIGRLFRASPPGPEEEALLRWTILRYVFDRFWDVLRDPNSGPVYLAGLRRDQTWMESLRWLYRDLSPSTPIIRHDFELMTWLQARSSELVPFNNLSSVQQFHQLVHFITTTPSPLYGSVSANFYQQVQILVDSGDDLSQPEIAWLTREVCRLRNELPDEAHLWLFLDSTWKEQAMQAVKDAGGSVAFYELPPWEDSELKELLRLRLTAWGQDPNLPAEWGKILLAEQLAPDAQGGFVGEIVCGAKSLSKKSKASGAIDRDAPVHALWLARWLVTKLAEATTKVTYQGVRSLVDKYVKAMDPDADKERNS